jgi:hypothetical protein
MGDEMNLSAARRTYLEVAEGLRRRFGNQVRRMRMNFGGDANLNLRRANAKAIHYHRGSSSNSSFEFDRLLSQYAKCFGQRPSERSQKLLADS